MVKLRHNVSPPTVRCNNCPLNTNIGATGLILKERGSYMGNSDFLHYKGYSAKADYSAEDRIFYGTILGISDMVEFQSENAKDLEDEFHYAVDEYLEFCKEIGKEPQKEYNGLFNVRIPPELHRQLSQFAQAEGVSLNKAVEQAIRAMVQG